MTKELSSRLNADPVAIYGMIDDEGLVYPLMLSSEGFLQSIDFAHAEVHEGESYTGSFIQDVANGANMDVILITPNDAEWLHFTYEIDVESESILYIYEDAVTGTGSTITLYNRDRNSLNTSGVTVQSSPLTVTTGTTAIRTFHLGSGKAIGGGDRATHEFILKQNTKYLIRINNLTATNNYMSLKIDFYKHEKG